MTIAMVGPTSSAANINFVLTQKCVFHARQSLHHNLSTLSQEQYTVSTLVIDVSKRRLQVL